MTSLNHLPTEILLEIAEIHLPHQAIAALVATNRRMHHVAGPSLFQKAEPSIRKRAMFWGTFNGNIDLVRRFLDTGADANQYWRAGAERTMAMEHAKFRTEDTMETGWSRSHRGMAARWREVFGSNFHDTATSQAELSGERNSVRARKKSYWIEEQWEPSYVDQVIRSKTEAPNRKPLCHWTLLHVAAGQGHDNITKLLLDYGADPSLASSDACSVDMNCVMRECWFGKPTIYPPWSPLSLAIFFGKESTARMLLASGAPISLNTQERPPPPGLERHSTHGVTALHAAARFGRVSLMEYIVNQRFQNPDDEDGYGETPLALAFMNREWKSYEWLLSRGAHINKVFMTRNEENPNKISGHSLLTLACSINRFAEACRLVDDGADLNPLQTDASGTTQSSNQLLPQKSMGFQRFGDTRIRTSHIEPTKRRNSLFEAFAQKQVPVFASEPLLIALRNFHMPAIDCILSLGSDIKTIDSSGSLHILEVCANFKMVFETNLIARLLKMGANARCKTERGVTLLHLVCRAYCHFPEPDWSKVVEIINLLLQNGADPVSRGCVSGGNLTPFELALRKSKYKLAKFFFSKSGQTSFTDEKIQQLFNLVFSSSDDDCIQFVLSLDKNNVIAKDGKNLLRLLTCSRTRPETAILLIDKGIPCTASIPGDLNTVYLAVRHRRGEKLIRKLLEGGAEVNFVRDTGRRTSCPLLEALQIDNEDRRRGYVRLLLEYGADVNLQMKVFRRTSSRIQPTSILEWGLSKNDRILTDMLWSASFLHRTETSDQPI